MSIALDAGTPQSPDYYESLSAVPLSASDRALLSMTDDDVVSLTWDKLRHIISTNQLALLKRKPSQLRKYIVWCSEVAAQGPGGIAAWLALNRLPWGQPPFDNPRSLVPFEHPDDFRILWNDWPYNMTSEIQHLVVWTRTPLPSDGPEGDITEHCRETIRCFVARQFEDRVGAENVLWFRNWTAIQSIRTLDHIHVLVRNASSQDLRIWTGYSSKPDPNRPPDVIKLYP